MNYRNDQFEQQSILDKKPIVKDKPIDYGRISRNNAIKEQINDILCCYNPQLTTDMLFGLPSEQRVQHLKKLNHDDKVLVCNLIKSLFC